MSKKSPTANKALQEYLEKNKIVVEEKKKKESSTYKKVEQSKESGLTVDDYGFNGSGKDHQIYIAGINKAKPLIYMNDKQIFTELLEDYSDALKKILSMNNSEYICYYLSNIGMDAGVCSYSRIRKGVNIVSNKFVEKYCKTNIYGNPGDNFWCATPCRALSPHENKLTISERVDILQKIVNEIKENERTIQ